MKKYEKGIITLAIAVVYFGILTGIFFIAFHYELQKALIEAGKSAIVVFLVVWFIDYISTNNSKKKKKK